MELHENGLSCSFHFREIYQGTVTCEGFVKWDGCINWSTSGEAMGHFCGPSCLDDFNLRFLTVWELGKEMMGEKCFEYYGK